MEKISYFRKMYYKDYSRRIVMDHESMKSRIEYVYEGLYYSPDCPEGEWKLKKILYFLITLISAGIFIYSMSMEIPSNYLKYIAMLQSVCLFLFLGLILGGFCRLTVKKKMTIWEYRMSVPSLKELSSLLSAFIGVILLCEIITAILYREVLSSLRIGHMVMQLVCLCMTLFLAKQIKKEKYSNGKSRDLPRGIDITNDFENF